MSPPAVYHGMQHYHIQTRKHGRDHLAWIQLILVDSSDMALTFDFRCLFISLLFMLLVVGFACLTAWRYLKKTNIMIPSCPDLCRKNNPNA